MTSIEGPAFSGCSGFNGKLTLGKKIQTIGFGAFSGCTGLTGDIQIPDSVTNIGYDAFKNCNNLSGNFYIPPSVKSIGNNAFTSAKIICGERGSYAETYAKNNNITFKTIDELQSTNPDDVKIESDKIGICAVDFKTGNIVPFSTIKVDGSKYKTGFDGILRISTTSGKHIVKAEADGYVSRSLVDEVELCPGNLTKKLLQKMEDSDYKPDYISGKLESAYESNMVIKFAGKLYSVSGKNIFSDISSRNMVGKNVICTIQNEKVTKVELLSDCIVPTVSMVPKVYDVTYSNGKYSHKEIEATISIYCGVKAPYAAIFKNGITDESVFVKKIDLNSTSNLFEFKEGKGFESSKTELSKEINKTVSISEPYKFTIYLCPKKDYVPDKVMCDENIILLTTYTRKDNETEYSSNESCQMHFNNLDMQKTESEGVPQEKIEKLRNDIKSKTIVSLAGLSSIYDAEQIKQMEEFLTLWAADITVALEKVPELSLDEKMQNKLLEKMGINPGSLTEVENKTATVTIEAETKKNGKKKVIYTLELTNFRLGNSKPFGSYGYMTWEIQDAGGIFPSSGVCTVTTKVDMDSFAKQLNSIASDMALSMINREFNSDKWSKDANAVASLYVDKTIMKVIDKKYGSFSNMLFTLMTKPTDMHIKSISKCPVDIYVYNNKDVLCGAIVDNKVYSMNNEVSMYVDDQQAKYVTYCENEYYLKFVGTDTGSMNHYIEEYADVDECVRTITYENIPLTDDTIYYEDIPGYLYADNDIYALISEEGKIVDSDSDTYGDSLEPFVFVDGIDMEETKAELKVGETKKLTANLTPANATNKGILWESRDESVAIVDNGGLVTAVSEGRAIIAAISNDGRYEVTCEIVVGEAEKVKLSVPKSNYETNAIVEKDAQIILKNEEGASIYYTIDGTEPTRQSLLYTKPIVITNDITIKAFAVKDGYQDSETVVFVYKVKETIEDPNPGEDPVPGEDPNPGDVPDMGEVLPDDIPEDNKIPDGIWSAGIFDKTYTGNNIQQTFRLYDGTKRLKEKTDYTISYKNNKAACDYTDKDYSAFEKNLKSTGKRVKNGGFDPNKAPQVIIKMQGNYSGTQIVYFRIQQVDITGDAFTVSNLAATYSGKKQTPLPMLTWNGKELKYGTDFHVPEYDSAQNDQKAFSDSKTYKLTVEGKNNFTGKLPITLTISVSGKQIAMDNITIKGIGDQVWTGHQVKPDTYTVKYKNAELSEKNGDYKVSFGENVAAGIGTITFTGTGKDNDGDGYSYIGEKTISFKIIGVSMSKVSVSQVDKSYTYTGKAIEPNAVLTYKADKNASAVTLVKGTHYTVTYQENQDKGTATMIFTGLESGGYTGIKKQTFKIVSSEIGSKKGGIEIAFKDTWNMKNGVYVAPYMKGGAKPEVVVTASGKILKCGKDYTVSYTNNKKIALSTDKKAPTVTIKGKGNYAGNTNVSFMIAAKALSNENGITVIASDKVEDGKKNGYRQNFKLYDADGKELGKSDYDAKNVTYMLAQTSNKVLDKNSVVAAGATIQIAVQGKGVYAGGTATGTYHILKSGCDISKATIQLNNQTYTGSPIMITEQSQFKTGKVYIKNGKETKVLTLGKDMEVVPDSYINNIDKGTAKVTFRGINGYGGMKTVSFKIGVRSIGDFWKGIFGKAVELVAYIEVKPRFLEYGEI